MTHVSLFSGIGGIDLAALPLQTIEVTFGEVSIDEGRFVIDAQPHVMHRVRALFKSGKSGWKGKYTHSIYSVAINPDNAKDIVWLSDRYPLQITPEVWRELDRLATRYDKAVVAATKGDRDQTLRPSEGALPMALPPRPHQIGFYNLARDVRRMLLADDLGLGKTISAITLLQEKDARPALIIVPTHLTTQWKNQISKFLPQASVYVTKGHKTEPIPPVDVVISTYTRVGPWQDVLAGFGFQTIIFDEVQDVRHVGSNKRIACATLSQSVTYSVGLSATPIYNMGAEIWSVMDVISSGCLGDLSGFKSEWCSWGEKVHSPLALRTYMVGRGLMLRRTRKDLGIDDGELTRDVITLEGDLEQLKKIQDVAKALAMSVLSNRVGASAEASRELDWKLRHATGVAKARPVAEFVKQIVESGEKVLLAGWHRDVYDIWMHDLKAYSPVLYTGTESPAQKAAAVDRFVKGDSQVFICSLRSGSGLDGLQQACSTIVFGELDWSPHVMNQMIGRLDREGQTKPVYAYYLVIDDGSDPFVLNITTEKQVQHDGLVEGTEQAAEILADTGEHSSRIREMAEAYLASIGEAAPQPEPQTGLHADLIAALRRLKLPTNSEAAMQEAVFAALPGLVDATIEREVRISERSRLDFLVTRGDERIAIECKIDQTGRASVYRQVRRYAEEIDITGAVILAPWAGVASFVVEETPVTVVDFTKNALRGGR